MSPSISTAALFTQNTVSYSNLSTEGPIWETTSRAQLYALECHKRLKDLTANHGMLTALLQKFVGFALNSLQYSRLGYFIPNISALNKIAGNYRVQHKF
jgi:hypothetical protein